MQLYTTWANSSLLIILNTSNFETTYKKLPFIKVAMFFWSSFSIKLSWLQRRSDKTNTLLYDR